VWHVPVNKAIGKRKNYRYNNPVEDEIVFKTEMLCIYSSTIGSVGEKGCRIVCWFNIVATRCNCVAAGEAND